MTIRSILVIDDSMSSRLVLRKMLEQYQVDVSMVSSVSEALDELQQKKPDAIFLDRYMPGTGGLQALQMFKDDAKTASVPVVMFTSLGPDDDPDELVEAGALAVLPKPFSEDALYKIMDLLKRSKNGGAATMRSAKPVGHAGVSRKALQTMVQSLFEEAVKTRIEPMLQRTVADLKRAGEQGGEQQARSGEALERRIVERVQGSLQPALQRVAEQLSKEFGERLLAIQQAQQNQQKQLDQRFETLEKQLQERIDSALAEHAGGTDGDQDDDIGYYMMDSIVEENLEGEEVWADVGEQAAADHADPDYVKDTGMPAMASGSSRYALVGLVVAVVIAVALILYLRNS